VAGTATHPIPSAASGNIRLVDDAAESSVVGVVAAPGNVPADHAGLFFVTGMDGGRAGRDEACMLPDKTSVLRVSRPAAGALRYLTRGGSPGARHPRERAATENAS
jgi:hypothetical protein